MLQTNPARGSTRRRRRWIPRGVSRRTCHRSGIYESECGDRLCVVRYVDESFPTCPQHPDVRWNLIKTIEV